MRIFYLITDKIIKLGLIIFFSLIFCQILSSQSITWQRILENNYGGLQKIQQTTDGSFIAIGIDRISNQNKMYLIKFDYLGNTLWTKIIGVGNTNGYWIEKTLDNGYIIGGDIDSGLVNDKAYIVKTDSAGNIQWHKTFTNSDLDGCKCVKQTPDGGYILSCRTTPLLNSLMYIKTDAFGNLEWRKVYQKPFELLTGEIDFLNSGYIAVGRIDINNSRDVFIIRLDNNGDSLWFKRFGGSNAEECYSVDKVENEGYIIGGYSRSFSGNGRAEAYICKLDTNGNILWQKNYSHFGQEGCVSVRYRPSLGYVIAGWSDSLNNDTIKAKIRVLDLNGNMLKENSYFKSGNNADGSAFTTIESTSDGGFIAAGEIYFTGAFVKMYVVKTDSLLYSDPIGIIKIDNIVPKHFRLYQNYPNPFNGITNIEFDILASTSVEFIFFDVLGNQIETYLFRNLKPGSYKLRWNAANLSSGIYFLKMISKNFSETRKLLMIK